MQMYTSRHKYNAVMYNIILAVYLFAYRCYRFHFYFGYVCIYFCYLVLLSTAILFHCVDTGVLRDACFSLYT